METVATCPLGHTCEEVRDGKVYRCRWFVKMGIVEEKTGQMKPDTEYDDCAIPLQGVHLTELKKRSLGIQSAVEKRMNSALALAAHASRKQPELLVNGDQSRNN